MTHVGAGMVAALLVFLFVALPARAEILVSNISGDENLVQGAQFTVSFPQVMAKPEQINVADAPCPVVFEPPLQLSFLWKSQSDGELTVSGPVKPGTHYAMKLVPKLKNLAGASVSQKEPLAEQDTPVFQLKTDDQSREHLGVRMQFSFSANYRMKFTEVAQRIYFQDRESHARVPVEVILDSGTDEPTEEGTEFGVRPREDLAMGREFDIVAEGVADAATQTRAPYLQVFPAGKTQPLGVEWVGAFNYAGDKPRIRIKFDFSVDPETVSADSVVIMPRPANLRVIASNEDSDEAVAEGDFDSAQHYTVRVTTAVRGAHGFPLAAESKWGATFRAKPPTILMPTREVYLRSRRGLKFAFVQVNTGTASWRLAQVPLDKLAAVSDRAREFEQEARDIFTGRTVEDKDGHAVLKSTEELVKAFDLKVAGEGKFDASRGDAEVVREIDWKPAAGVLAGAYLLEVTAPTDDGRLVGNRTVVCFSDAVITEKVTPDRRIVRVARMSDGQPLAGVPVRMVSRENYELASGTTDAAGLATLPAGGQLEAGGKKYTPHLFIADTPDGAALQFVSHSQFSSGSTWGRDPNPLRVTVVTDRNLYRPGETVKMFGIVRVAGKGALAIPAGEGVAWKITNDDNDNTVAEGTAVVSGAGSWNGEWAAPATLPTGGYSIQCQLGKNSRSAARFRIEEFRPLPFSVDVVPQDVPGAVSRVKVSSVYFHGAPNGGARVHWKAAWNVVNASDEERDFYYNDSAMLDKSGRLEEKEVEGDAVLDANGAAIIGCPQPFADGRPRGRFNIAWTADVGSPDGQTVTGGAGQIVQPVPEIVGIKASQAREAKNTVEVEVEAKDRDNNPAAGVAAHVALFHITTKTVKEQVGAFVYRYCNAEMIAKTEEQDVKTPAKITLPAAATGRYAVVATLPGSKDASSSSVEVMVSGDETAELPVEDDTNLKLTCEQHTLVPGDKASISVQSPFGGLAWVCVETDDVLDTFVTPMPGNAGRIEVPVKKEYAPNATVTVHLLKPGGAGELPMERFGFTRIDVKRPDLVLDVAPVVEKESVEPRQHVSGGATVTCGGKPVANAEVTVFAVDERVLKLGDWKMADLLPIFYPPNPFAVVTYEALGQFVEAVTVDSQFQKGFIIGGGGKSMEGVGADEMLARKKFRILAFWQSDLQTGADGRVAFDFDAPDNLSTFRVTAVAHTKESQFGSGETKVMVTKKLICDAALPRFLRVGDEVELRAVGRQRFADGETLTAKCVTDAGLELLDAQPQSQDAKRDVPAVFKFRAKVRGWTPRTTVRFELAAKSGAQDIVENTLPIHEPTVLRKESVGGVVENGGVDLATKIPAAWKNATGKADVTISTSPWLPKLLGLPQVLDYPHGCFEQIGSRVLSYALLGDLLAYLPDAAVREKNYAAALEDGVRKMQESPSYGGFLPYWPGGTEAHPFVTVLALWATSEAANAGFDVDGGLIDKLAMATKDVVAGKAKADPFTRAFALMVTADNPGDDDATVAQDLYLRRNDLGDEGRALLAVAMKKRGIMPKETTQLLREIAKPAAERAFDPQTFSSTTRAEAMRALAFATVTPDKIPADLVKRFDALMDSSEALSTQENLWLLIAFDAMHRAQKYPALAGGKRMGFDLSKNGASTSALAIPFGEAAVLSKRLSLGLFLKNNPASSFKNAAAWLMRAEFRVNEAEPPRDDRGRHVERVVRDLTDTARTGDAAAPFKLGDRILVTYRLHTRKLHNYVALEDLLPAGLETINPDLPAIGKFFELPREAGGQTLALSHSELRDQSTCLYFDRVDPGAGVYSVLARATCAGTFRWPQTQAVPMYDSRFGGLSAASLCVEQE